MQVIRKISNALLYGIIFTAISAVVSLFFSDEFSLHPNEASADIPSSCTSDGGDSGGCGCAGCGSCDSDAGCGGCCDSM